MAPDPRRPPIAVFRVLKPAVRRLLGSRFHRVLSDRLMLLTFRGRRSGGDITTPIGYLDWDGGVLSLSSGKWWVNLAGGDPVQLQIGQSGRAAIAAVAHEPADVAGPLEEFARRHGPKAARGLILGLPGDRMPIDEELARTAARTVVITFTFTE